MSKMIRTAPTTAFQEMPDDNMIICRCEEITKGEIRRAVYDGFRTTNEVKRWLRCGMGLCQGQTCQRNFQNIIARELGIPVAELGIITGRCPVRPVEIQTFADEVVNAEEA
ncbi:MAG: (2Fe-2S)-binding protein [Coriobacteriia bacterium]|nr:(2Fe-2S)-binding protein [Coriobacteriia bacterium]